MSSMVEEGSGFLDGFSPVSPASSEGSTDTILSSGASDLETSPRRGSTSPLKKTRYAHLAWRSSFFNIRLIFLQSFSDFLELSLLIPIVNAGQIYSRWQIYSRCSNL